MRRIFVFTVMLFATITMMAQKKVRSVSLELLGAQNLAGINYDSRFKGNSGLGYRVGIGFGYGNSSYWINQDIKGVGVPIELNYLLGKRHHKLEVGFGTSMGLYHVKETVWLYYQPTTPEDEGHEEKITTSDNRFGYFMFGDIGYRYQRDNGFMFRVGFSPSFNFGDKYGLHKTTFFPYIGLGWSF